MIQVAESGIRSGGKATPGRGIPRGLKITLCVLLVSLSGAGLGQPASLPLDREIVRVGVYQNSPKVFVDVDGRPSGIFVDIIEAIAEREGWRIEYLPGTWQEGLQRLTSGEIDLMPDVARTADRMDRFAFHDQPALSS